MKTLKSIVLAGAAIAFVGVASAQQAIKITGSTAFRSGAVAAMINSLKSEPTLGVNGYPEGAYIGTSITATQAIIHGHLVSTGAEVYYQLAWDGSISGVSATGSGLTTLPGSGLAAASTWISLTQTGANALTHVTATRATNESYSFAGGTSLSGTIAYNAATAPDATFSDSSAGSIYASGLASAPHPGLNGATTSANPTTDGECAVVVFVYVKGPAEPGLPTGSYARLTNLSEQQIQALWTNGYVPLSAVTGNIADQGVDVVLVGRNNDSGSRLFSLADAFISTAAVGNTWALFDLNSASGDSVTITQASSPIDNGGFSSGGKLASAVNETISSGAVDFNGNPFILVTYLGVADAFTVVTGNGTQLTLDGVGAPIINPTGGPTGGPVVDLLNPATNLGVFVQQGAYEGWENEHLYFRPALNSTQSGALVQAVNDAYNAVYTTDAIAAGLTIPYLGAAPAPQFGFPTARTNEFTTINP